ncbi:MAG TPA: GAF domain-containing sensor histidine kinase, partial [Terriglobales bacterium]
MNRGDYLEETYYSFSYSPIRDESGKISGLFCPSAEVTSKVLNARRLRTLSELSATAFIEKSVENACASITQTLAKNYDDVPFALLYMLSSESEEMRLQGHTGFAGRVPAEPRAFIRSAFESVQEQPKALTDLLSQNEAPVIPVQNLPSIQLGPAQQRVKEAIVLPVRSRAEDRTIGILIAGVNPTRKLDADYRTFFELVAGHVATAIANARAYQSERRRVETLAELDRAKTTFFSNISHEFRTPLTLMLGPIEARLARPSRSEQDREEIELLHRNALRLLKLVNALLDFSRIEAGRVKARFEPADLGNSTAELASVFRSAAERAGLQLRVQTSSLAQPVYIDREMWEKIILNLLSNAFKSTFEGEITVRVRQSGHHAEVSISDTGTGIPASELPHLFERFRRIEGARRRTNEGSGIGLALVSELVAMHGGAIDVRSELGTGTTFTITLPFGTDHLPADQIARRSTAATMPSAATAYVQEALSWLPGEQADPALDITDALPAANVFPSAAPSHSRV